MPLSTRSAAVERARHGGRLIQESVYLGCAGSGARWRVFLNTLEQSGAFLVSLWMCAVFVSCALATTLSSIALGFRALMPVL